MTKIKTVEILEIYFYEGCLIRLLKEKHIEDQIQPDLKQNYKQRQ
jgi:hypothetical protein